jgi:uncharacterized protein YkwD
MSRRAVIACLMLSPVLMQCGSEPSRRVAAGPVTVSTGDARTAAGLISDYRRAHGLAAVTVDTTLNRAAEAQARVVAEAGTLSHGAFASRMASFGIGGTAAENLAAGSHTPTDVVTRWKASPGHNANMLMPEARRIGLARARTPGVGYEDYWVLVLGE